MISNWLPEYQNSVEKALHDFFDTRYTSYQEVEKTFEEALRYAVEGGGKRLRAILCLITYEFFSGKSSQDILASVVGIEMIHAYTLVHDDLPCMDNDTLRRGKPTVWKKYGETMAVLVGDALQCLGFELLASSGDVRVLLEITHTLGDLGVVRGQVRDTMLRHDTITLEELLRIHDEKTGVFIASALVIGGYLAGVDDFVLGKLRHFGMLLGRSFQIRDDILDAEGYAHLVGKNVGKDISSGKGIVALVGIEASKDLLASYESEMIACVREFKNEKFVDIISFVVKRDR